MSSEPRVLITGISGFIAKHCAVEMLRAGYRVRGTVRSLGRAEAARQTLVRHVDVSRLEFVEADLESDGGWAGAAAGCAGVLHVASPFPARQPKDEQQLIRPAVEGTRRVLRAAIEAAVERFVQTSSTVAIMYGHPRERTAPFTEADWTQVDAPGVTAYAKSKTLAERAARELAAQAGSRLRFCSVNPGFVMGPVLDADIGASAEIIRLFMRGKYPGAPRLAFPCVDVRDVARAHRLAFETDAPGGGRYVCSAGSMWMIDIARAIRSGLPEAGRKAPDRVLPDWVVKLVAVFDPTARLAIPDLGRPCAFDVSQTRRTLRLDFIPASEAALAMARSLVALKLV